MATRQWVFLVSFLSSLRAHQQLNPKLIKFLHLTNNLQEMQKLDKQVKQLLKEAIRRGQNRRCCTGKTIFFFLQKQWPEEKGLSLQREKRQNNQWWALIGFCIKETGCKKTFLRGPDKFEYGLGHIWEGQISLNMDQVISELLIDLIRVPAMMQLCWKRKGLIS